jgi:sugar phosphate permease
MGVNDMTAGMLNNKRNYARLAWIIWAVAALYYSYEFFLRISPTVMVPDLMQAFKVDAAALGILSACYYYAYASMQIPVGMLLDRFGIRRLLTVAALLVAGGCFAFAYTTSLWVAEVARIFMGLGSAFAFISCVKLARAWFTHTWLAVVIGLTNTLGVMGAIFGEAPLAHFVLTMGWRETLWIAGGVGLTLALLISLIVRNAPKNNNLIHKKAVVPEFWQGLKCVVSKPSNWLVGIFAGLMVAPISAFTELWSVPFLMQVQHVSRVDAALLSTIMFIGIACGGPVHGWLSGRFKSRLPVLRGGAIGALVCLIIILYIQIPSEIILICLLLFFGFFTSSMLLCFAINSENNPLWATGVAVGFTNMLVMAGGAVFQPLVGYLLDVYAGVKPLQVVTQFSTHDFQLALTILPICLLCAVILVHFIKTEKM